MRLIGLAVILAFSLFPAPLAAEAQQAGKVYRIGLLGSTPATTPAGARAWDAFVQGLQEHGFVEGQNVVFVRRYSEGYENRHAGFVAEFIQMKVDLMVTGSSAAVRAAKDATSTIPIVMLGVANPERQGLVASLARPGGNVTGTSNQLHEVSGKTYQLVKEALPRLSKLAIMWNPDNPASVIRFKEGDVSAAAALKIALVSLEVRGAEDLDRAFATITLERPEALWVHLSALPFRARILNSPGRIGSRPVPAHRSGRSLGDS